MRWSPFVAREEFESLKTIVDTLQGEVRILHDMVVRLRSPALSTFSNLEQPLDEDQQKLVEMLLKDRHLRKTPERGFASGGLINRRAEGRFGEQTSDQVRSSDLLTQTSVDHSQGGPVDFDKLRGFIAQCAVTPAQEYPGSHHRRQPLPIPPRGEATGFRDPQPPGKKEQ